MKAFLKSGFLFSLLGLFIIACKKDDSSGSLKPVIGTSAFTVTQADTFMHIEMNLFTNKRDTILLDINNDSKNDFRITLYGANIGLMQSYTRTADIIFQCINTEDSVLTYEHFPVIVNQGASLDTMVYWQNTQYIYMIHQWQDWTTGNISYQGTWNNISEKYIGLKIEKKYAWVKLSTITSNTYFNVTVHEYGIEK